MLSTFVLPFLAFAAFATADTADTEASCPSSITPRYAKPSLAAGYTARIIANGLTKPRGIMFDKNGHLLVVQQGYGLTSLTLKDNGGACVSVASKKDVIRDTSLNHGLEMTDDGKTLYASSTNDMWSWAYDGANQATSSQKLLVTGMQGSDHSTRTLTLSRKVPGLMLISRGSFENLDLATIQLSSGRSQVRVFNVTNVTSSAYDYSTSGLVAGWGLRNSVGVAENPISGGIYTVENSADDVSRSGTDVHQNNPGEEMNFLGYLNGTYSSNLGKNYGYPICFTAWAPAQLPQNSGLVVGSPFAIGYPNATNNDNNCRQNTVAPRLTFPAHWAPLDIKFSSNGRTAWVTSHGSWDRTMPDGYLLFQIAFNAAGEPVEPPTSQKAVIPILSNANNSACPSGCFRPVGLAWDSKGRLYMSSDSTGEIYVITKSDGSGVDNTAITAQPSTAPASLAGTATATPYGTASGSGTGTGAVTSTTGAGRGHQRYTTPSMEWLCTALGFGCLALL